MIRKLLPLLLGLIGLGLGIGIGWYLRPSAATDSSETVAAEGTAPAAEGEKPTEEPKATDATEADTAAESENAPEYVKLTNQFVIPVLRDGQVESMVVLALSLEVTHGSTEEIYAREPKLRDGFLQVLFDHANAGGFNGSFTDGSNLVLLRRALLEQAQSIVGEKVTDVLISDIARQDS